MMLAMVALERLPALLLGQDGKVVEQLTGIDRSFTVESLAYELGEHRVRSTTERRARQTRGARAQRPSWWLASARYAQSQQCTYSACGRGALASLRVAGPCVRPSTSTRGQTTRGGSTPRAAAPRRRRDERGTTHGPRAIRKMTTPTEDY